MILFLTNEDVLQCLCSGCWNRNYLLSLLNYISYFFGFFKQPSYQQGTCSGYFLNIFSQLRDCVEMITKIWEIFSLLLILWIKQCCTVRERQTRISFFLLESNIFSKTLMNQTKNHWKTKAQRDSLKRKFNFQNKAPKQRIRKQV